MERIYKVIGISVWFFSVISPAWGNDDLKGGRDHPLLPRMQHFIISSYEDKNPFPHDFQRERMVMTTVEGRGYKITYCLTQGITDPSALEVSLHYQNIIKAMGGSVLFVNSHSGHTYLNLVKDDKELWVDVFHNRIGARCREYTLTIVEKGEIH